MIGCFSGPLLYHFEDIPNERSFELSYDDLRTVIRSCGFQIEVSVTSLYARLCMNRSLFIVDGEVTDSNELH